MSNLRKVGLMIILIILAGLMVVYWPTKNQTQPVTNYRSVEVDGDSTGNPERITETKDIFFRRTNKQGQVQTDGNVFAILFNPQSSNLDFKVNVPLVNPLYEKDSQGKLVTNYTAKTFGEIVDDQNSKLDSRLPFAAINADYIGIDNHPQGYNVSRGISYSGNYANRRSSFAISGGQPEQRQASIQIGPRSKTNMNFNVAGGNGRFYTNGQFADICQALGQYACSESTNRSLAAITSTGWVIFLVYQETGQEKLLPSEFDDLLEKIAQDDQVGHIQDGILFDGGRSPGLMYDSNIYAQSGGSIGSVFLVYLTIEV